MFFKAFRDVARPHWYEIITTLKSSTGMSVGELSKELKMSYMGVKQHCVELHKRGYLDTWRRPSTKGRPEMEYRLTSKGDPLFPRIGDDLILQVLETTQTLFGSNIPEKLMFSWFQEQTTKCQKKLRSKNSLSEKATAFARMRDTDGHLAECAYDSEKGLRILEYHNPLQSLFDKYPSLERIEETHFERVLGTGVTRTVSKASGLVCTEFSIETL